MSSFIGEYKGKVDAKGRVVFPSAFKKQMPANSQARFVLKPDINEKSLLIYTIEEWERQAELIRSKLNSFKKSHAKFLRGFYRSAVEVSLDSNSRMLIPARLLKYAEIDKELYLCGLDKKIEIVSKENYEISQDEEFDFAELAEEVMGGDFAGL